MLLAIESSCDETAVAICSLDSDNFSKAALHADLVSSQMKLHAPYGGVVPELASREHVKNLPFLVEEAFAAAGCSAHDVSAVAATCGPGLKGSLLVGLSFAKAFAVARDIPFLPVNHLEGHLFAGQLLDEDQRPEYPYIALIVSGGHTMLVLCNGFRSYDIIAETRDDAAGEAFDKSASLLSLPYPGGPSLSARAAKGNRQRFRFPVGMHRDAQSFSFSGLKTAILRTVQAVGEVNDQTLVDDLCASIEQAIVQSLVEKTLVAVESKRVRTLLLTGGVAANGYLRNRLADELKTLGVRLAVPPAKWCTDNAAMIAAVGWQMLKHGVDTSTTRFQGALPRFPLDSPELRTPLSAIL